MGLPTIEKSWQFNLNNTVAGAGSVLAQARTLLRAIKDALKGFGTRPWTVAGSSDSVGAGMDAADRWDSDADLVWAAGASAHAWIVLKSTDLTSNFQLLLDLNSANAYEMTIAYSISAGFTGGSTTARPTATDEHVIGTSVAWGETATISTAQRWHVWHAVDGLSTMIVVGNGGQPTGFLLIQKPKNPRASWTNPIVVAQKGISTATSVLTYANFYDGGAVFSRVGSTNATGLFTSEGAGGSTALGELQTVAGDLDADWPISPMAVYHTTSGARGRNADIYDLWWGSTGVSMSDSYPDTPASKSLGQLGHLIFPSGGLTLQVT